MRFISYHCTICGKDFNSKEIATVPWISTNQMDMMRCLSLPIPSFSFRKLSPYLCKNCIAQYNQHLLKIDAALENCEEVLLVDKKKYDNISFVAGSEIPVKTTWRNLSRDAEHLLKALAKYHDRDMVLVVKREKESEEDENDFLVINKEIDKIFKTPDDDREKTIVRYHGIAVKRTNK